MSGFSVSVKPFPVLPCLGIAAVLLGLFKCQAPQHNAVGLVDVRSVEANDVVHGVSFLGGWEGPGGPGVISRRSGGPPQQSAAAPSGSVLPLAQAEPARWRRSACSRTPGSRT